MNRLVWHFAVTYLEHIMNSQFRKPLPGTSLDYFDTQAGFLLQSDEKQSHHMIPGWVLLQYHQDQITPETEPIIQYINAAALKTLLGGKPLNSKQFFSKKASRQNCSS